MTTETHETKWVFKDEMSAGFNKARKAADISSGIKGSIVAFDALINIAGKVFSALGKVVDIGKELIEVASEEERVEKRLQTVLKSI